MVGMTAIRICAECSGKFEVTVDRAICHDCYKREYRKEYYALNKNRILRNKRLRRRANSLKKETDNSIVGKTFNQLTVIKIKNLAVTSNFRTRIRKLCVARCVCGTVTITRLGNVLYGYTKSCGCRGDPRRRKKTLNCICPRCDTLFETIRIKRTTRKFCSEVCTNAHHRSIESQIDSVLRMADQLESEYQQLA